MKYFTPWSFSPAISNPFRYLFNFYRNVSLFFLFEAIETLFNY